MKEPDRTVSLSPTAPTSSSERGSRKGSTEIKMASVEGFVEKQSKLLNIERNAEIEEASILQSACKVSDLERKGVCISKLYALDQNTGLYGRHVVKFGRQQIKNRRKTSQSSTALPSHRVTSGDIVGIQPSATHQTEEQLASGIVTKVTEDTISVAFEEVIDFDVHDGRGFRLSKLTNDVTYGRLKRALIELKKTLQGHASHLIAVLFGLTPVGSPLACIQEADLIYFNKNLNDSQKAGVKFALSQKEIGIIHGPPGTGKTTTVIEIIRQAVKQFKFKVLACAPSNIAVDNLVEKLAATKIRIVRLGHPARALPIVQKYSLDALLTSSDSAEIIKSVRKDIQDVQEKLQKHSGGGETQKLRSELRFLKKELITRERKAMKDILSSADVVLSTTTSASSDGPLKNLKDDHFDLAVVDEAAQAIEASCWIPLLRAPRCILAGDHHQLPPTIISQEAAKEGLEVTLMERAIKSLGDVIVHMLTTQYRMNEKIMLWPSHQLYGGELIAHDLVKSHLLREVKEISDDQNTSIPLLFIDTAGSGMQEMENEDVSKGNEHEVQLVEAHVDTLVKAGVNIEDIGVITPYNLQVELLRQRLTCKYNKLEIKSVDGFQGREKEAIIISLVRSNDKGEVGFLKEDRRINVAITRARRHLAVIGDSETISHHGFLKSFYEYVREHGEVRFPSGCSSEVIASPTPITSGAISDEFDKFRLGSQSAKSSTIPYKSTGINKTGKHKLNVFTEGHEIRSHKQQSKGVKLPTTIHNTESSGRKQANRDELFETIKTFLENSTDKEYSFPATLSSQERFLVHEIAEGFGIYHESRGEGKERYIFLSKNVLEVKEKEQREEIKDDNLLICPNCNTSVPKGNMELHLLKCATNKLSLNDQEPDTLLKKKVPSEKMDNSNSTKRKKKQAKDKTVCNETEDDIDELIASFTKADSHCAFEKCKGSVLTLGQNCRFCSRLYCLQHHLAEVHGCGTAAKTHARQMIAKANGGYPSEGLNEIKRNYVKKKLDEKLNDLSGQRRAKPDKKKS